MSNKARVSNERKNLTRLAGEFLVASRLTQRGYMITLQWGTTIGYDILVFDRKGRVAFLEVKTTWSHQSRWILQAKYASPAHDAIPLQKRFVCCVDMTGKLLEPVVYVFPAAVVARGLEYYYANGFSNSDSYTLPLDSKPRGHTKDRDLRTVGAFIEAEKYRDQYDVLPVDQIRS